jgi:hypothetical protein
MLLIPPKRYPDPKTQPLRLEGQITFTKQLQLELDYEFPALSALGGESKNTLENNRAILARIPEKFGEMRGSIGDLERQIQSDPKVALRLDKVVEQTLKAEVSVADARDPKEVKEVLGWLANEGFWVKQPITDSLPL